MARILVVDDDLGMRDLLEIMLSREGYDVTCCGEPEKALQRCRKEGYDLVITDLKMPRMDGIEFLKNVKEIQPECQVILITAFASGNTAVSAMKEGAYDYLEKNFDIEELKRIIREALEKKGVKKEESVGLKDGEEGFGFGGMIGNSKAMRKVYEIIMKVSETTANILIWESGTGKKWWPISMSTVLKEHALCGDQLWRIPENLWNRNFRIHERLFTGAFTTRRASLKSPEMGLYFLMKSVSCHLYFK